MIWVVLPASQGIICFLTTEPVSLTAERVNSPIQMVCAQNVTYPVLIAMVQDLTSAPLAMGQAGLYFLMVSVLKHAQMDPTKTLNPAAVTVTPHVQPALGQDLGTVPFAPLQMFSVMASVSAVKMGCMCQQRLDTAILVTPPAKGVQGQTQTSVYHVWVSYNWIPGLQSVFHVVWTQTCQH